jgi:hypothetical protein
MDVFNAWTYVSKLNPRYNPYSTKLDSTSKDTLEGKSRNSVDHFAEETLPTHRMGIPGYPQGEYHSPHSLTLTSPLSLIQVRVSYYLTDCLIKI